MIIQNGIQNFQLVLGDTILSSKECIVKEVEISQSAFDTIYPVQDSLVQVYGYEDGILFDQKVPRSNVEVTLRVVLSNEDYYRKSVVPDTKKLRDKKVEDCTVHELLFAAKKKLTQDK